MWELLDLPVIMALMFMYYRGFKDAAENKLKESVEDVKERLLAADDYRPLRVIDNSKVLPDNGQCDGLVM